MSGLERTADSSRRRRHFCDVPEARTVVVLARLSNSDLSRHAALHGVCEYFVGDTSIRRDRQVFAQAGFGVALAPSRTCWLLICAAVPPGRNSNPRNHRSRNRPWGYGLTGCRGTLIIRPRLPDVHTRRSAQPIRSVQRAGAKRSKAGGPSRVPQRSVPLRRDRLDSSRLRSRAGFREGPRVPRSSVRCRGCNGLACEG